MSTATIKQFYSFVLRDEMNLWHARNGVTNQGNVVKEWTTD
jgi:hypothetical protein